MSQELSDIKSFEHFYNQHYEAVMRYCVTIVKDTVDAGDVVQQVFVHLWQKRNDIDIHTSAKAYLYKAAYHHSLQFLKQGKNRKLKERQPGWDQADRALRDRAAERELEALIENAVDQLPEQCRRIFRMSRDENLKYREIAERLHLSEKTVENQMGKALKQLRISLQEYLPAILLLISFCHAQ